MDTYLIVGLGNPGPEYADTRHNAGFKAIDALADELGVGYWKALSGALVAEAKHNDHRLILIKPQRYMNLSGVPLKSLLKYYGLGEDERYGLLVVHDELDLPDGLLRLKNGGGHGGHRGVLSVIEAVGAEFFRLRIGIGRPPGRMPAERFVLLGLSGDDLAELEASAQRAVPMILAVVDEGLSAAMNRYN